MENPPHGFGFGWFHIQPPAPLAVAEQAGISIDPPVLDSLLKHDLGAGAGAFGFKLSAERHKLQHQFITGAERVEVFFEEPDHNPAGLEPVLINKAFLYIARKPGHILDDDHIKPACLGVRNHLKKTAARACLGAADGGIGVCAGIRPGRRLCNQAAIGFVLVVKAVALGGACR